MHATPHIWLAGPEAEAFAQQRGLELVPDNAHFTTQQRREQWERYRQEEELAPADEIVQQVGARVVHAAAVHGWGKPRG